MDIGDGNMENKEAAEKEWKQVLEWAQMESRKVIENLKKEGKYEYGLDTNSEELAYIGKERNRRLKEIQKKYSK